MENLLEKVKEFVNDHIEIYKKSQKNEFNKGYFIALIDIIDYIKNQENEQNLVGKWGYFWDHKNPKFVIYGKLESICDCMEFCSEKYSIENLNISYQNFSLTIPEHCKNN